MKSRALFYLGIAGLVVVDGYLISKPNLLGKLGFIIYKYHYLRTFPKAVLTVALVAGSVVLVAELLIYLAKKNLVKRRTASLLAAFISLLLVGVFVKTSIDFQGWAYSHSGTRLWYGAHLLPLILLAVFVRCWLLCVFFLPVDKNPPHA
ncbi:MAG: hypothetical protein MUC38_16035 [Cyclobacteriaceae bacterium]|jgi:hypothetical protein|nr:hypothetical protein [Cyclobacteriaceae bacterium]